MTKRMKLFTVVVGLLLAVLPAVAFAEGDNELPEIELTHSMKRVAAKVATCTTDGNIAYYYCTGCKKYFSDKNGDNQITEASTIIPAKGHSASTAWSHDDSSHWHVCATCGTALSSASHTWDTGAVTTKPTCTSAGIKTFTCYTCGDTRTEEIAALGHDWDDGVVTTEPTETTKGVRTYTCRTCGSTRTEEFTGTGLWLRLSGSNRYKTMAAIVDEGFESCSVAVLASGEGFADALVASSVAGAFACPVVLTAKGSLSSEAAAKLTELGVKEVYVVGGESAVSKAVADTVESKGIHVERISGTDRQKTSLIALQELKTQGRFNGTVVIATGFNFADALSVGPYCYANATPILLAGRNGKLSEEQASTVKALGVTRAIVVGGPSAVKDDVYAQLGLDEADSEACVRLSGDNRYETSEKIARWELEQGMTMTHVSVATGANYPDALAGAALCGIKGSPLVLVSSTKSPGVALIREQADNVELGYVLGGTSSVSDNLLDYLRDQCGPDCVIPPVPTR